MKRVAKKSLSCLKSKRCDTVSTDHSLLYHIKMALLASNMEQFYNIQFWTRFYIRWIIAHQVRFQENINLSWKETGAGGGLGDGECYEKHPGRGFQNYTEQLSLANIPQISLPRIPHDPLRLCQGWFNVFSSQSNCFIERNWPIKRHETKTSTIPPKLSQAGWFIVGARVRPLQSRVDHGISRKVLELKRYTG